MHVFKALGSAPSAEYPNVARWYKHIESWGSEHVSLPGSSTAGEVFVGGAAAKKAAEDDDDDFDDKPVEEPKAKNPLDLLPKSTFNLEDWKRAYSNMDTRGAGGSLEWFYQQYVFSSLQANSLDSPMNL